MMSEMTMKDIYEITNKEMPKAVCNGKAVLKGTRLQPITIYNYISTNHAKYEDNKTLLEKLKNDYLA